MPVVPSSFAPRYLLANAHIQTLLGAIRPRQVSVDFRRERLELSDGDFLDLDWIERGFKQTAILSHGLEGSSRDSTIRGMAAILSTAGWNVLAWNYRGCSGEPNRLPRAYHSGDTPDLQRVIDCAARRSSRIALVGFSLGGNLVLKYLGEKPPHPAIIGAVAISAPIDLASSARKLDKKYSNRFYLRRLIRSLVRKIREQAGRFPEHINPAQADSVSGFEEFDSRFTAPLHGFLDADDYWSRCSARQFLSAIRVPVLLLNAMDDPFLTPSCFPFEEAKDNFSLYFEAPPRGGHLGFIESLADKFTWAERRTVEFLSKLSAANVTKL